jgi:CheY-like chemotaxis protein
MATKRAGAGSDESPRDSRRTPIPKPGGKPPTGKSKGLGKTPRPKPREEATPPAPAEAPLVLVVDDYQDAREMCAEYLSFTGFRVAEASNGVEALDKAFMLLPDVILMDLSLPGIDGWEATRRLKADERTRAIPVVAVTGHALAGHSEGAKQAGCDAFITKPCLPDALVAEVRRVLAAKRR